MAIIQKVTIGYVVQQWDTAINEWVNQEFIAGDQVEYTDEGNNDISDEDIVENLPYLPLEMVQPSDLVKGPVDEIYGDKR